MGSFIVYPLLFVVTIGVQLFTATEWLYRHLHLRDSSSLTTPQKEMVATVVNGKVDGAA